MSSFLRRALLLLLACYGSAVGAFSPPPGVVLNGSGAGLPSARSYGQSLATNAQYLAVGAPGNAAAGVSGAVWIYSLSDGQYGLFDVIEAPVPSAGDGFGQHVQFIGNQLLVGAPRRTVGGVIGRGEVFVYLPAAGQFDLVQTLQPGVALGQNDLFGFHLSADSGWLAVGAPFAGNNDQGQVQLYRYDGDFEAWVYHSAISGSAGAGRLGIRVLMRGDRLLAAATQEEGPSPLTLGYVYEYQRSGSGAAASFAQVQRFRPTSFPVATAPQAFGSALGLSPDASELLVGAPFDEDAQDDRRGAVYAFARVAGQWTQRQRVVSPAGDRGENFGSSLVFDDDGRVLVGDIRESDASGLPGGAVHEFTRPPSPAGQNWSAGKSWLPAPGTNLEFFGNAIALSGRDVIISAPGHDRAGVGTDVGQAYVYNRVFKDGFE